jgi:glycosyltransferase involved in cell wall biosynthesis
MSGSGGLHGLRVCLVGPFLPRAGELSRQNGQLAQLLQQEGVVVHRVNTDVPWVRRIPVMGLHLLPLVQIFAVFWRLLFSLRRADIVHVQATSYWGFFLPVIPALFLGKLLRRRTVISYSGGLARDFMAKRWRLVRALVKRADGLAVTSDYVKEIFQREGLAPAVVPTILDLETTPFVARTAWPPLLLWSSVLETEANPAMALVAFARLKQTTVDARLMLIGKGSLAADIASQARDLGIDRSIAYRAELADDRWRDVLHEASVFWHTASLDNLPQRVLEAAACGTVVVGTDVGAISELLHHGVDALLVQPEDALALAEATQRVLARPYLAESLVKNARLSAERYAWVEVRPALAKLYGVQPGPTSADEDAAPDDVLARTEFLMSDPSAQPLTVEESIDPPARRRARR